MSRMLLIDIGNTNLKWAWDEDSMVIHSATHIDVNTEVLAQKLWGDLERPTKIWISSVAGEGKGLELADWMKGHWDLNPMFARSSGFAAGVTNSYTEPSRLGVDRWLTLIAVKNHYQKAACIVDCGTAITIDLINFEGLHLGGLILPGIRLMRESIFEKTHIPLNDLVEPESLFARDTYGAIASSTRFAAAALIERSMREGHDLMGVLPALIMTGRDAELIGQELQYKPLMAPDLVLQGLRCLAREES